MLDREVLQIPVGGMVIYGPSRGNFLSMADRVRMPKVAALQSHERYIWNAVEYARGGSKDWCDGLIKKPTGKWWLRRHVLGLRQDFLVSGDEIQALWDDHHLAWRARQVELCERAQQWVVCDEFLRKKVGIALDRDDGLNWYHVKKRMGTEVSYVEVSLDDMKKIIKALQAG